MKVPLNGGQALTKKISNAGHVNDLASEGYYFYVAYDRNTNDKTVGKYNMNLELVDTLTYIPAIDNNITYISCIAHYEGNYFVVGNGLKLAMCEYTNSKLHELTRFNLDDSKLNRPLYSNKSGQGIYIKDEYLYKIFSYSILKSDPFVANAVAQYRLVKENGRIINTVFEGSYYCDNTSMELFELEDMVVSPNNSTRFYISTNERYYNQDQNDRIIEVQLTK